MTEKQTSLFTGQLGSLIEQWRGPAIKTGSIVSAILLLCDLAQPIAPFATIVAVLGFLGLIICLSLNALRKVASEPLRMGAFFSGVLLLVSIVVIGLRPSVAEGDERGLVAGVLPVARTIQDDVAKMLVKLDMIEENTGRTAAAVEEMRDDTKLIVQNTAGAKRETSEDPRKELANMGVDWQYQNFMNALGNGDVRVAKLFIDGGMKIRQRELFIFLENSYHPDIGAMLAAANAIASPIDCVKNYEYELYQQIEKDSQKRKVMHGLCNHKDAIAAAEERLRVEREAYDQRVAANKGRSFEGCMRDLTTNYDFERFYDEAARFNILAHDSIRDPLSYALAQANAFLLAGSAGSQDWGAEAETLRQGAIREGCDKFGRPIEPSRQGIEAFEAAIRIFSRG